MTVSSEKFFGENFFHGDVFPKKKGNHYYIFGENDRAIINLIHKFSTDLCSHNSIRVDGHDIHMKDMIFSHKDVVYYSSGKYYTVSESIVIHIRINGVDVSVSLKAREKGVYYHPDDVPYYNKLIDFIELYSRKSIDELTGGVFSREWR